MTAANFIPALNNALVHEGGFSDHPDDPGGATMKGVTQAVYDAYRKRKGLGRRSVRLIDSGELNDIYRRQYWDAIKGDKLPAGVDYAVFDGAVNSGPTQSVKWLQRALGTVNVDGSIACAVALTVAGCNSSTVIDGCRIVAPIAGSPAHDTPETMAQIDQHNAKGVGACGCKAAR